MPTEPSDPCKPNPTILRAIDANLNRAREAFRVVEDICRFGFGDRLLTRRCKSLRHELSSWSTAFDVMDLVMMRDAAGDVGRHVEQKTEYVRKDIEHLLKANFSRAEQALRSIEELSKTVDAELAQGIEQIRYGTYELERAVLVAQFSAEKLADTRLYVLVDGGADVNEFVERIRLLVDCGVDAIQLREKSLDTQSLLERAETLVQLTRQHDTLAIINDRVDVAMAARADGVHLGQQDMPIDQARKLVGPRMLIGLSTHSIEQARRAEQLPVNYIGVGPTFPSNTKSFENFTGPELLVQVADEISLPAFAIGGINESNLQRVTETGFHRVAVSGAFQDHSDESFVRSKVAQFKAALASAVEKAGTA